MALPPEPGSPTVRTVTLLVAHGSRNPRTAADHTALCNAVADASGRDVRPAFLELSDPSIGDAIDDAVGDPATAGDHGAGAVRVLPLFVHVGGHVEHDIPAIVDAARHRHPDVVITLGRHIGADPGFVRLVADAIR